MTALTVAAVSLRRALRDRTALFFLIALPVVVIVVIGATVRGFSSFPVGVVDLGSGASGRQLTAAMASTGDLRVHRYATVEAARKGVARGEVSAAVVLPAGMDRALRAGEPVTVDVLAEQSSTNQQAAVTAVRSAVDSHAARIQAALFATAQGAGSYDENLDRAGRLAGTLPMVRVEQVTVDRRPDTLPEGFSYSAPTMLTLFVFINTLAGAGTIVATRRLGLYERMRAAPLRPGDIVAGEVLGLMVRALLQAALIVAVGSVAFGVSWGDPAGALLVVGLWAVVSAGAGVLAGTLVSTPEQAAAVGSTVGILLGMLGGCMWPLSIVAGPVRALGHFTPQAWAVDAWTALIARGSGPAGIVTELAVLGGFAVALSVLAAVRLRRVLA